MKKQDKKTIWLAMNDSSHASYLKYGGKNHERSQGGQEQSERWKIQSSSNQSLTYVSVLPALGISSVGIQKCGKKAIPNEV